MPNVSVIMSVYNEPSEWLRISIQSILNQTYSDFEFIIVNDKPDNIENAGILREYMAMDSRITIISNEQNIGLTKSLNKALNIATGNYIARMDADDMSLPERFEHQVTYLDQHPEILVLGTWTESIDKGGNKLDSIGKYETDYRWVRAQFIQNSQISHPSIMFRRVINGELVQYDESLRYAQDYSLMVKILQSGEITNLPEILFCYRNSDIQITSSKKDEQQRCAIKAQTKAFALFNINVSEEFLKIFHHLTIQHDMNLPLKATSRVFKQFFMNNSINQKNTLALEIIYGTYMEYLRCHFSNSRIGAIGYSVMHSTMLMHFLGLKLCLDLLLRKLKRSMSQ